MIQGHKQHTLMTSNERTNELPSLKCLTLPDIILFALALNLCQCELGELHCQWKHDKSYDEIREALGRQLRDKILLFVPPDEYYWMLLIIFNASMETMAAWCVSERMKSVDINFMLRTTFLAVVFPFVIPGLTINNVAYVFGIFSLKAFQFIFFWTGKHWTVKFIGLGFEFVQKLNKSFCGILGVKEVGRQKFCLIGCSNDKLI